MKNVKVLIILLSFSTTILKSQTIIEKSTLLKEITEFHDDGIPKTINYLNENLELVIQEKFDIFSDLISSYQYNPKTQKKDGPFVYYPYSNIYNQGFRNSKNDFDFKNVVNKGVYENGIIIKCEDCEFFIESENDYYTEYKKIRKGDILNGRFIGEVSIFNISEGSNIGSIQNISDQLTSYYGRKINYTMSFRNGEFTKDSLYSIYFDSLGYVKDGVYNFKKNKYYFKNRILSGIITYNENNNIPKDSIFSEGKVWKINNKFSKNTGWITSEENIINPLNLKLSNKYGRVSPRNHDEGYDKISKLDNLYKLISDSNYYTTGKNSPINLFFFGSEKSELLNMYNYDDNYISRDKREIMFNGRLNPNERYRYHPNFFNLGISILRHNKLDSNGIYSLYNHNIIYKYVTFYISGILSLNKNYNKVISSPIINKEIVDYKKNNFSIDDYYFIDTVNKWSVFEFVKKYLQNKTIDSLKKDVRINFSNLNIENYNTEKNIKYLNNSVSEWIDEIYKLSKKGNISILDQDNLMSDINNYTDRIEKLLIEIIKLTNSKVTTVFQKNSPLVLSYNSNFISKKIKKTTRPELLNEIINYHFKQDVVYEDYLKIENLQRRKLINPSGNISKSFKYVFESLIENIEKDISSIDKILMIRKLYLDLFFEKNYETNKFDSLLPNSNYIKYINHFFYSKKEKNHFTNFRKTSVNYRLKNIKKIKYFKKFSKHFGEEKVNLWNDFFSKKIIEDRILWDNYENPSLLEENLFNENININFLIEENNLNKDFSELLSYLIDIKSNLSNN